MLDRQLSALNHHYWQAYYQDLRIRDISADTVTNYFQSLLTADRYFKKDFAEVTQKEVREYVLYLKDVLAPSSSRIRFVSLRVFYNWMVREGYLSVAPTKGVKEPTIPQTFPEIPEVTAIQKILKAASGTSFNDRRDTAIIRLMVEPGGLRKSEVTRLKLEDVDSINQIIKVNGKGSKVRFISYGDKAGQALNRYLVLRARHRYSKSTALWLGLQGGLDPRSVAALLTSRCKKAGIPSINPHAIRHFAADQAMAAGVSDLDMMTLFGWSNPRMLAVYGRSNKTQRALQTSRRLAIGDRL